MARDNGSLVTVQEISRLLAHGASETELAEAIVSDPSLGRKFELKGGYLTERQREGRPSLLDEELIHRRMARRNLGHAARFAGLLGAGAFKMVAVSGSTSYGSASASRDLDLFCVAPSGKTWLSLTAALVMARIFNSLSPGSPQICLSCMMDENFARSTFAKARDPLFARDALETKVLKGMGTYESLMEAAGWISSYYPLAYERVRGTHALPVVRGPSALSAAFNQLLFRLVGRYLGLKASALNRKLKEAGRCSDLFEIRSSPDHLIYESKRYTALREKYRKVLRPRGLFNTDGL
ncbi:MAG: hypothetical protein JRN21_01100 [Nitrososphaerota archaeon]|nr:hypothetical protein [Nitrososphaerota archaeon]